MDLKDKTQTGGAATLPHLISVEEAAELLAVSRSTVHNWIKDESIPYIKLPGSEQRSRYRIPLQGLLNTLSGNYDLAGDLERVNAAAKEAASAEVDVRAELRNRRSSRTPRTSDRPRQLVDAKPSDAFEHAEGTGN
jgi:excisionase family DNA binding protein